jgi:predicted RNA-binding protein YlxR (DUF448 family)
MTKNKHKPQRMCVACRKSQDKKSLIRLVRTPDGVVVDQTGKLAGRGAYLHAVPECWERGVKKNLEKALNVTLNAKNQAELIAFQETFSAEDND